jgi:homoserine O-acetyltransferase/O-succinyltransferase
MMCPSSFARYYFQMRKVKNLAAITFLFLASFIAAQEGTQQYADLGSCRLENGQSIADCRIGYRTFGIMNADRSNVALLTTWFLGNSEQVSNSAVGSDKFVDPSKYFIIAVDALGDGVSSSPSNSKAQPRMHFPVFTIRDMVETQRRLLLETFHLDHVHAILGGSMGGMQALQWAYSYPGFMDRVVALVPSPRLTSYDLLLWRSELNAIQSDVEWRGGDYTGAPMIKTVVDIHKLHLQTPSKMVNDVQRSAYPKFAEDDEMGFRFDPNDEVRQLQALMSQDVAPGKSMEEMAKMLKPPTMIVVATQDMMANPIPATQLAKVAHLPLIELTSDCGHLAPGCESAKVNPAVREFLAKK